MTALAFKPVTPTRRRAKVLLLGEPGVGKTHAALSFPKCAVIDAEGSIDWFADRFSFVAVPTKSYAETRTLVEQIRNGRVPCETLVIDSLTSIYNSLVNVATLARQKEANSDDLRPLDWGRIKRKFSSLLDELYHKLDVNVVCVGWIKPEYAKAGDRVNGKAVSANDLIKIGEQFDGDRKTAYAFDFVIKVLGNDGKRARAEVLKSRSGVLKAGQIIEDFSYATLAKLMPTGADKPAGMVDEEAEARDKGVLDEGTPPSQPSAPRELDTPAARAKVRQSIAISCTQHGVSREERHRVAVHFLGSPSMAEDAQPRLSVGDLRKLKTLLSRMVHDRQIAGKAFDLEKWIEVTQ